MKCNIDTWRKLLNFPLECKGKQTDKHTKKYTPSLSRKTELVPKTVDKLNAVINF